MLLCTESLWLGLSDKFKFFVFWYYQWLKWPSVQGWPLQMIVHVIRYCKANERALYCCILSHFYLLYYGKCDTTTKLGIFVWIEILSENYEVFWFKHFISYFDSQYLKSCANFHSVNLGRSNTLFEVKWFYVHILCYFELQYFKIIKVTESCAIFIL